jgi:putative transposase
MLKYKSELYGKYIFEINPRNTSKICSNCYEVNSDLKLKDREWKCNGCHTKHDRDINAACNILRLGQGLPEYKALLAA